MNKIIKLCLRQLDDGNQDRRGVGISGRISLMNALQRGRYGALLLLSALLPLAPLRAAEQEEQEEEARGPHEGRLLRDGGFTLELAIFEAGVAPEFRAWAYEEGEEIPVGGWDLTVELERLGGETDRFEFLPAEQFRRGEGVVEEPHSFDVTVTAVYEGQAHRWEYESYEGRVTLDRAMAEANGLTTATAGPQVLRQTLLLYGRTQPDPQGITHVRARFPGLIREMGAMLGEPVEAGQRLAVIEANNSLQTYVIEAPRGGIVVEKHANPGETAGDEVLLTIADYSRLWADLSVFPGDADKVRPGQSVRVRAGGRSADTSILYLNPGEGNSPAVTARAPLENEDQIWTPGLLVEGEVTVGELPVDLAVDNRALQTFRDWQVVFIRIGEDYEVRPLELGRTDGRFTEVLEGLPPGATYVVENSYLLKADLEKAGATHDH